MYPSPLLPEGAPPIRKAELAPAALSAWVTAGYDAGDSSRYTAAILAAASHPNSALDVRLPSAYWYRWEEEGRRGGGGGGGAASLGLLI